jgi:hypothetical protein
VSPPSGLADALAMLEKVATAARRQGPGADEALISAVWLSGFLSTLSPDGLATAERHADRVEHARELLPLVALVTAWGAYNSGARSEPGTATARRK